MNKVSGGLNPCSKEADIHAEKMYDEIRKRNSDFINISRNTNFSIEQVQMIKSYIFFNRHYLKSSSISSRFDPSYEMAESWRRLSEKDAKNVQPHDVLLLYHELYEIELLLHNNISQSMAHDMATEKYNYQEASDKFYKQFK